MIALRVLKEVWMALLAILLFVPGVVVGYFAAFLVNGLVAGYHLQAKFHRKSEEES